MKAILKFSIAAVLASFLFLIGSEYAKKNIAELKRDMGIPANVSMLKYAENLYNEIGGEFISYN